MLPALALTAVDGVVETAAVAPDDSHLRARVRTGLVVGLSLGGGIAGASGYPNDALKIGDGAYFAGSGAMFGTSTTVLVMGALADYVNFGFWFNHAVFQNSDWHSSGNAGGLRLDFFPFIDLYPRLRGLAVFGEFGVGGGSLTSVVPNGRGSSGTQSFAGAGAFYEWSFAHVLGGHFGAGPSVEYDAIWSQPFERHGAIASARLVFYGGP